MFKYFEVKVKIIIDVITKRKNDFADQIQLIPLIVSLELFRGREASGFLRALMLDVPV